MLRSSGRIFRVNQRNFQGAFLGAAVGTQRLKSSTLHDIDNEVFYNRGKVTPRTTLSVSRSFPPHMEVGSHRIRSTSRDIWSSEYPEDNFHRQISIWSEDEPNEVKFIWIQIPNEVKRNQRIELETLYDFIGDALDQGKDEIQIVSEAESKLKGMDEIEILKALNLMKEKRFRMEYIPEDLLREMEKWDNID